MRRRNHRRRGVARDDRPGGIRRRRNRYCSAIARVLIACEAILTLETSVVLPPRDREEHQRPSLIHQAQQQIVVEPQVVGIAQDVGIGEHRPADQVQARPQIAKKAAAGGHGEKMAVEDVVAEYPERRIALSCDPGT